MGSPIVYSNMFFLYKNLISSLRRIVWILFCVIYVAGDIL